MAFTIGKYGLKALLSLAKLIGCFYATSIVFDVVMLGVVMMICGLNIFKFIKYMKEELLIVLGTSSSESALPHLEGRGGGPRRRLHHPRRDAVRGRQHPGRRPHAPPRRRSVHVRGARAHEPGGQRRGGDRGLPLRGGARPAPREGDARRQRAARPAP